MVLHSTEHRHQHNYSDTHQTGGGALILTQLKYRILCPPDLLSTNQKGGFWEQWGPTTAAPRGAGQSPAAVALATAGKLTILSSKTINDSTD